MFRLNMSSQNISDLFNQAFACHQGGELLRAESLYLTVIRLDPGHFDAIHLLGVINAQLNRMHPAHNFVRRALRLEPSNASANQNLGNILSGLNARESAEILFRRAIVLLPGHVDACFNLSNNLLVLNKKGPALKLATWVRCLAPQNLETLRLIKRALLETGQPQKALQACNEALAHEPESLEIRKERAHTTQEMGDFAAAVRELRTILTLSPCDENTLINLSKCFLTLHQLQEADKASMRAVITNPRMPEARINLGGAFQRGHSSIEAKRLYRAAISLDPSHADGLRHLGVLLSEEGAFDQSIQILGRALRIKPNADLVASRLLADLAKTCDWSMFDEIKQQIQSDPNLVVDPLSVLWVFDDLEFIQQRTRKFVAHYGLSQKKCDQAKPRKEGDRIRLAYFSSDFRDHPVAHNLIRQLQLHDRNRFEVIGFDFSPVHDEFSNQILSHLDKHHPVKDLTDESVAELSRRLGIDIAIDLNGHTTHSRTGIFLYRAAPIQINYLGYPGTMGSDVYDFIIADEFVIPKEASNYYAEKVLRLPSFFMPYPFKEAKAFSPSLSRSDFGLPENGFIFASFNNIAKLTPEHFGTWMQILNRSKNSFLWMAVSGGKRNTDRILQHASRFGISPSRIIFATHLQSREMHIDRLSLADLMLDTYPYNGHTTACDAIQAGLPILTRCGQTFASRVVSSLLTSMGLSNLITYNEEDYRQRAIYLSEQMEMTEKLKASVRLALLNGRLQTPISYAQNLDTLLENAVAQSQGLSAGPR